MKIIRAALAAFALGCIISCVGVPGAPYNTAYPPGYGASGNDYGSDYLYGDSWDDGYPYDATPVYGATVFYGGPGYYYPGYGGYYTRYPYYYRHGIPYDSRGRACRRGEVVFYRSKAVHHNLHDHDHVHDFDRNRLHNADYGRSSGTTIYRSPSNDHRSINPFAHHSPEVIHEMREREGREEEERQFRKSSSHHESSDSDDKKKKN
jgi:hypothetical protein